jgi:hypothetical protein
VGLAFDYAGFGGVDTTDNNIDPNVSHTTASTTRLGVTFAFIANPDRVSFYGELGLAERWFDVRETGMLTGLTSRELYEGGEFTLGLGIWIPAGRSFRVLPKFTVGFAPLNAKDDNGTSYTANAAFGMLGVAGFYNVDL